MENIKKELHTIIAPPNNSKFNPIEKLFEIKAGSMRPLAIACVEDKIVQEAVRRIIENIYEPNFKNVSHGYRPERGCATALVALDRALRQGNCGAVLEIDLRKYFNTIPHEPLERMLRLKVKDERFLHLILKLVKAPTVDEQGQVTPNDIGSPQGSIVSPVLANIYLHYVLDIWFAWVNENKYGGSANMVRYADDGVFTFRSISDAEDFRNELKNRLEKFGISLHEGKTKIVESGRQAAEKRSRKKLKMHCFTFLGFLHVWGQSRERKTGQIFWRVKRRTCPIRFKKKLAEFKEYIKSHRHDKNLILRVKARVIGHLNYFGINDNGKRVAQFLHEVRRLLFKWLNRRSQKKSYDWKRFAVILNKLKFPDRIKLKNLFFSMSMGESRTTQC